MPYYSGKENQYCYNILQNISHVLSHLIFTISEVGIIFSHFIYRRNEAHLYDYVVEVNRKQYFGLQVIIFLAHHNDWLHLQSAFIFAVLNMPFVWNNI